MLLVLLSFSPFCIFFSLSPFSLHVRTWAWVTSSIFRINETLVTNPLGSFSYEAPTYGFLSLLLSHFTLSLSFSLLVTSPLLPCIFLLRDLRIR